MAHFQVVNFKDDFYFSLSVGYVDNMGRFITEIEPDPFRRNDKQSRISRAVKKLINIEQDEVSGRYFELYRIIIQRFYPTIIFFEKINKYWKKKKLFLN